MTTVTIILSAIFVCSGNLKSENAFAGDILEHGKALYSQGKIELIIRDFFNDRAGGVFLDVGCGEYSYASNTYYLEKHLGWSGVGVDALCELGFGYLKNRPRTRFFNFLVTDHSGTIEAFIRSTKSTDVSSTNMEVVKSHTPNFNKDTDAQIIYIPTITLTELLDQNGISKIEFLSMDINGGELKALAGFDIDRFKPEFVCIEAAGSPILDYFEKHGYERIEEYREYDTNNSYFRPKRKESP